MSGGNTSRRFPSIFDILPFLAKFDICLASLM
jgi:hypothetical protein